MESDDEMTRAQALGRYADRVLGGAPGERPVGDTVDPNLAETVHRLRELTCRAAPPEVNARVWAQVVTAAEEMRSHVSRLVESPTIIPTTVVPDGLVAATVQRNPSLARDRGHGPGGRVTSLVATAGLLAAALVAVAVLIGLPGGRDGSGGRQAAVTASASIQPAILPAATPSVELVPLDRLGGGGGLWNLPPGDQDLSIRVVRYTVSPGGRWVIPSREGSWIDWWIVEGMLYVPNGAPQTSWSPYDGYREATMPGTELTNRRTTPTIVLELRIEAGMADILVEAGTTVEIMAGGPIGPMDGQLAAVQVEPVWGSRIVDTTRGGAALVVIGPEAVTFHRDGGELVTGGNAVPDDYGSLTLGGGTWALLSGGAAFHFDAAPPDESTFGRTIGRPADPTALIVTIAPNAAVVQEHENPTPTPIPTQ